MKQTDNKSTSSQALNLANWMLLAAASIAWTGIVVHMYVRLDLMVVGPESLLNRIAIGTILLGIVSGIANVAYFAQTEKLSWQWLLIGIQIVTGLVALYLGRLNTTAMMLIIGMAQVPARSGLAVIGAVFAVTNIALGVVLVTIASAISQALVEFFLFMGFQLFALTVAVAQQRERLARDSLAAVNAELIATRGLVANSARTEERLRVSRELHDIAGHTLTAINVRLEAHSRKASDELKAGLLATRDLGQELLDDIRAVVSHLRQHDPVCIQDALRKVCESFPGATIHLSIDEELRFERPDQATAVLRCVQEGITNAVRHGAARNIWVMLRETESDVELTVRDDGVGGIDYQAGHGLRGIEERMATLGGHLSVEPSMSKGWTLEMRFPRLLAPLSQATK